jgi:conjugal transfer pilus assembly protein TraW
LKTEFLIPVLIALTGGLLTNTVFSSPCITIYDYGVYGEVYPIKEIDIRKIMLKKWKVNLKQLQKNLKKKIIHYYDKDAGFPYKPNDNKTYYFTPKYTLPVDIKDPNGKILYPKGYTFNPLDRGLYIPFEICFVTNKEVKYLPKIPKKKTLLPWKINTSRIFVVVKGNAYKLREKGYLVWDYGLSADWIKRMGVKEVPACVKQIGNKFLIRTGVQALFSGH